MEQHRAFLRVSFAHMTVALFVDVQGYNVSLSRSFLEGREINPKP